MELNEDVQWRMTPGDLDPDSAWGERWLFVRLAPLVHRAPTVAMATGVGGRQSMGVKPLRLWQDFATKNKGTRHKNIDTQAIAGGVKRVSEVMHACITRVDRCDSIQRPNRDILSLNPQIVMADYINQWSFIPNRSWGIKHHSRLARCRYLILQKMQQ